MSVENNVKLNTRVVDNDRSFAQPIALICLILGAIIVFFSFLSGFFTLSEKQTLSLSFVFFAILGVGLLITSGLFGIMAALSRK